MVPGWFGINFPTSANELESLLSVEMKTLMDNPDYYQLRAPLTLNYPIAQ